MTLAAAFSAVYATQPVPQTITAHGFQVVDDQGRLPAWVASDGTVKLYDAEENVRAIVGVEAAPAAEVPVIRLYDAKGNAAVMADVDVLGAHLTLWRGAGKGSANITVPPSGTPTIDLEDAEGYSMDLGSTSILKTVTGEKHQTSAASITMFGNGKEHRVIWQAP